MAAYQRHDATIIKLFCVGFGVGSLASNVATLALIDSLVRDENRATTSFGSSSVNPSTNLINKSLGEKIGWFIKFGAISSRRHMTLTEVTVGANHEVRPSISRGSDVERQMYVNRHSLIPGTSVAGGSKASRTSLLKDPCTFNTTVTHLSWQTAN
jgi:hypothetical protein